MKFRNNISPEELEQIEQYLFDAMSTTDKAAFVQAMQSDATLAEKVREVRLLSLGISEAVLSTKLNAYHETFETGKPKVKNLRPVNMRWALAASVALLIALCAWWALKPENSASYYAQYYKPDPGLMTVMSADNSNYVFEKAMVEYKTGAYNNAATAWSHLLKEKPGNDTLLYFMGAAYQASDDLDKAVKYLQRVATDSNSRFQKDALWYLGLIYLRKGDNTNAQKYLQASEHEKKDQLLDALKK